MSTAAKLVSNLGELNPTAAGAYPEFRIWDAMSLGSGDTPSRAKRRTNALTSPLFNPHIHTLLDYPTILAHRAGNPEYRAYNRLTAVQMYDCGFECWHCYNDARSSNDKAIPGAYEAKDVVEHFVRQHELDCSLNPGDRAKQTHVLRISGGEPFLAPGFIRDVICKLEHETPKTGLRFMTWVETSLQPFAVPDPMTPARVAIGELKDQDDLLDRFCVHPCLHGTSDANIREITGTDTTFEQLMGALQFLVEAGVDVYPTVHANASPAWEMADVFKALFDIHPNLPLRVALIEIELTYAAVETRMSEVAAKNRSARLYAKDAAVFVWNRLLEATYGIGYGTLPRHLVGLEYDRVDEVLRPLGSLAVADPTATPESEIFDFGSVALYFSKSTNRPKYKQDLLTAMALPEGALFSRGYEERWVQPDFCEYARNWPSAAASTPGLLLYSDDLGKGVASIPLRPLVVHSARTTANILTACYRLGGWFAASSANGTALGVRAALDEVFGGSALPPGGRSYVAVGPGYKPSPGPDDSWQGLVGELASFKELADCIFYKIHLSHTLEDAAQASGADPGQRIVLSGGELLTVDLEWLVPGIAGFDETGQRPPLIKVESTDANTVRVVGPDEVLLGKYGSQRVEVRAASLAAPSEAALVISCPGYEVRAPYIRIPVHVLPRPATEWGQPAALALAGITGATMSPLIKYVDTQLCPLQTLLVAFAIAAGLFGALLLVMHRAQQPRGHPTPTMETTKDTGES